MTIQIETSENGRRHIITDDANPRIYAERWKCTGCGCFEDAEEIVWARPDGTLDTDKGDPYCVSCVPDEGE